MRSFLSTFKLYFIFATSTLLATCSLAGVVSADPTCTPPSSTSPGVHQPVGSDAGTYTYDCSTGLWENQYYTFNPATGIYTPLYPVVYTYDPSTGEYDTTTWIYNAPTGQYVSETQVVAQPPAGADVVGAPSTNSSSNVTGTGDSSNNSASDPSSGSGDSISNTGSNSNNTINDNTNNGNDDINQTGSSSNNTVSSNANNTTNSNNTNSNSLDNSLNQTANTGDAIVLANTTAGSATSGDAQDVANELNLLQSTSNLLGGNAVTFVTNINGNVNGNFLLNPADLSAVQSAANNTTVNSVNTTNTNINNDLNLNADSGNATVADNTNAGSATSGSAQAIANVVNLIDSSISSGKSFVGVVNINGNLNGNIEVPSNFVNQLIADNVPTVSISTTGSGSNNTINNNSSSSTNMTNTNNAGINNVVNTSAKTGTASVSNNTNAGSATSGSANTNITAFNLTGSDVIGSNDLLVFVNVLGSWVGMIINAPPGATAAEIGGGILTNGTNDNTNITNTNNQSITNDITADAASGNASVTANTNAGNATSGDADSAVNLLNVENSDLSLSSWFGVLFINVFGSWNGNFTVVDNTANSSNSSSDPISAIRVLSFTPTTSSASSGVEANNDSKTSDPFYYYSSDPYVNSSSTQSQQTTLAGAVNAKKLLGNKTIAKPLAESTNHANWILISLTCLGFVAYTLFDRLYYRHRA